MSIVLDGSNLTTTGVPNSGTAVASTSGTSITFTGLPAGTKRITVMFSGVSTNGSSNLTIRLGSGSVQATGYSGAYVAIVGGASPGAGALSSGFSLQAQGGSSDVHNGIAIFTLLTGNVWAGSVNDGLSSTARVLLSEGVVSLSGTLDRVSVTTENGTDTFDAGSINILYE